jgi:MFS family permease
MTRSSQPIRRYARPVDSVADVLTPYADLLRRPGTLRFSASGFVQRLPMSMLGLGEVLFLTLRGEPYAVAGAISAIGALASAGVGPFVSRYVDRYTQHRVLPLAVSISVTFQVAFVLLVLAGAPMWTWFVTFALGEAFVPNGGSLIRARWAYVLDQADEVRTAFALESVLDEAVFVTGPPIATLIAVSWVSWGAIGAAIALLVTGTALLVPQRSTEPPAAGVEHRDGKAALRYAGVPLVFAVFLLVGSMFGAVEVDTVAFAAEQDIRPFPGVLLAIYALGSGIAGLLLGVSHPRIGLPQQFRIALVSLAVVGLPFPFVSSPVLMGVLSFVAGFAVAPSLITGFALTERLVPATRLTEGLTVVTAGITVGFAVGTAAAGPLIDAHGASTGFVVLSVSAVLAAAVTGLGPPYLTGSLARADAGSAPDDAALASPTPDDDDAATG